MLPEVGRTSITFLPPGLPAFNKSIFSEYEKRVDCSIGVSYHIREMKTFAAVQSQMNNHIILMGESGLRQEQFARLLHQTSRNRTSAFYSFNARGLNGEALYMLLFGPYGVLKTCKHGTVYLNELVKLPNILQQRLAAYFEEQQWPSRQSEVSSLRFILATPPDSGPVTTDNRIAYALIEQFRASSFLIKPLRERREDIPHLAQRLLNRIARRFGRGELTLTENALQKLSENDWERNIDELDSVLESTLHNMPPTLLDKHLLPSRIQHASLDTIPSDGIDLQKTVENYERSLIKTALRQTNGNQSRAAQLLGLRVQTLNMKLKRIDNP